MYNFEYNSETKSFTIKSGSNSGAKRKVKSGGYLTSTIWGGAIGALWSKLLDGSTTVGALIGIGVANLSNWLMNIADESDFNRGPGRGNSWTLIKTLSNLYDVPDEVTSDSKVVVSENDTIVVGSGSSTTKSKSGRSSENILWAVDKNPDDFDISLVYEGTVTILFVNDLSSNKMMIADGLLESYCRYYRLAKYKSYPVGKNQYIVEVYTPINSETYIPIAFINNNITINILTRDSAIKAKIK